MARFTPTARGLVCTALLGGPLCASAHAQLTHEITFDDASYPAGFDLNLLGGSDLGFTPQVWFDGAAPGTGSFIVPGSLTDPQGLLPTSGNRVSTAVSDFNLAFYSFDANGADGVGEPGDALAAGEHWISFLATADANADFAGVSLVKFFGDEILYIGKVGGSGGTEWGLDQGTAGSTAAVGSDVTSDTLIVAKLTIGPAGSDDFVDLFINPTLGTLPTTPDIANYAFNEDPNLLNIDGNRIRQIDELRIGSQNGALEVDEFRIGATFFDVTIPEVIGGLPGDANNDGVVDLLDFDVLAQNFGSSTGNGATDGDFNGDGTVDLLDFDILAQNFGATSPAAVPEPASLALLGLGGAALLRRRR